MRRTGIPAFTLAAASAAALAAPAHAAIVTKDQVAATAGAAAGTAVAGPVGGVVGSLVGRVAATIAGHHGPKDLGQVDLPRADDRLQPLSTDRRPIRIHSVDTSPAHRVRIDAVALAAQAERTEALARAERARDADAVQYAQTGGAAGSGQPAPPARAGASSTPTYVRPVADPYSSTLNAQLARLRADEDGG